MNGHPTGIFERRWNAKHLAVWGSLAMLLFVSWLVPATRAAWDVFDVAAFDPQVVVRGDQNVAAESVVAGGLRQHVA